MADRPPKFWRFDFDQNGTSAIDDLIECGAIENVSCPNFDVYDEKRMEIMRQIQPGDWIMLDTISMGVEMVRTNKRLGSDPFEPIWVDEKMDKYFGDAWTRNVYAFGTAYMMRPVNNFLGLGARVISTFHERDIMDDAVGMKVRGPDANGDTVSKFIGSSSHVFRLTYAIEDDYTPHGSDKSYPIDTRFLWLRRGPDWTAKCQAPRAKWDFPAMVVNPNLTDIFSIIGTVPKHTIIYGLPGAGKTSVGGTVARALHDKYHKTKK